MNLDRRTLIAAAAAVFAAPSAVLAADEAKPVPLKKVFPYFDLYLGIPAADRTRFALVYYLKINGKPAVGQTLWAVSASGARTALTTGADGRFTKLPSLVDLKSGTLDVQKARASDKYGISMEIQPLVRLTETVSAADLIAAMDQCNAAIRKKAGLIGLAIPKMEQVVFPHGEGTVVLTGGKTAAMSLVRTAPAFKPAVHPGAVAVKFTKVPARALLAGGKAK